MLCNTCVVLLCSTDDSQSRLSPLVTDEHPIPTLRVANRPLVSYPLEALTQVGVTGFLI